MDTRACTKCKIEFALEDFPKDKSKSKGRSYICRSCTSEKFALYMSVPKNKARKREMEKLHHEKDPEREARYMRSSNLKRNYGITQDEWDAIFEAQGSKCATCGATEPGTKNGWPTDHCHRNGKVRGILCHQCNIVLGWFELGWEMPTAEVFTKYKEES